MLFHTRSIFMYENRNISRIRKFLYPDACRTVVQALVTSRLDYGNALLYGLPNTIISRFQRIQNSAARIVNRVPMRDHITPVLMDLHWLPGERRIEYKILLYTFKALNGTSPAYIAGMVQTYRPTRSLRSQSQSLLCVPKTRATTYGDRTFGKAAAVLWNGLPQSLRSVDICETFKQKLKTYLFNKAFG